MTPPTARLLIVDDETALMQALCNTLTQQGYQTTGCASAEQALQQLRSGPFDLMLTDLMMPGTDGLVLAREALGVAPQMAIVMMTGQGSIATAVEAMQSGVLDYVLKPFKLGTMLPVLQRALTVQRLRAENDCLQRRIQERTLALENANLELEAYATAVSHDLRAPLRSVDGLATLLAKKLEPSLTPETRYVLELIGRCARRGQGLAEDLLRLAHVSRQPLERSAVDLRQMAAEVVAELQAESPSTVAIPIEVSAALPTALRADAGLLRQVLVNLLGNALKFSQRSPQARIEITCAPGDGETVLCVADNGPGFEMSQAQQLFKPFERLQGAQEFEGSGVGLSIVQRHGGRIWAQAEPGQGARFYFTLGGEPADPVSPRG